MKNIDELFNFERIFVLWVLSKFARQQMEGLMRLGKVSFITRISKRSDLQNAIGLELLVNYRYDVLCYEHVYNYISFECFIF